MVLEIINSKLFSLHKFIVSKSSSALMTTSHHFERGDYITVEGSGGNCRGDQTYMNQIQIRKL